MGVFTKSKSASADQGSDDTLRSILKISSLRKHPFLHALRRWGRFPRGEERGVTDVFAGY